MASTLLNNFYNFHTTLSEPKLLFLVLISLLYHLALRCALTEADLPISTSE